MGEAAACEAAAAASVSAALLPAARRSAARHNARIWCRLAMSGHFHGLGCPSKMLLDDSLPDSCSETHATCSAPTIKEGLTVSCTLHPPGLSFLLESSSRH